MTLQDCNDDDAVRFLEAVKTKRSRATPTWSRSAALLIGLLLAASCAGDEPTAIDGPATEPTSVTVAPSPSATTLPLPTPLTTTVPAAPTPIAASRATRETGSGPGVVSELRLSFPIGYAQQRGLILYSIPGEIGEPSTAPCDLKPIYGIGREMQWVDLGQVPADSIRSVRINDADRLAVLVECGTRRQIIVGSLNAQGFGEEIMHAADGSYEIEWESNSQLRILGTQGAQRLDVSTGEIVTLPPELDAELFFAFSGEPTFTYVMDDEERSCDGANQAHLRVKRLDDGSTAPVAEQGSLSTPSRGDGTTIPLFNGLRQVQVSGGRIAWLSRCEPFTHIFTSTIDPTTGRFTNIVEHRIENETRVVDSLTRTGPDGIVLDHDGRLHLWTFQPEGESLAVTTFDLAG